MIGIAMKYPADLSFQYFNPTRIVFGPGSARDAGTELGNLGCRRALLVTDRPLRTTTDIVGRVQKALGSACAGVFDDVPPDSGVGVVERCAAMAREAGADSLVSVGGGSVIDTAKGAAILLTEGGSLLDYQGFQMLTRRQTPHLCIPTTAGTGSEVTYAAVIKDPVAKRKLLFADYHIIPDTAILDPELTLGLPRTLTAATGMDAFSHALEAIASIQREPIADALGLRAIALITANLPL
ncbi:MAG: iron-containing alcohol dehydrogenase, partial [Spirochaetaceae bacterium]|nr:iron-containing alcohol dehydrogenase [Spirochaetaceae bacterium]